MAKDPAFLFYSNDFMSGTQFFTDEQVGKYIRLLIAQHQHGRLNKKQVDFICKMDDDIMSKMTIDSQGLYYNERLETEINKRKAYSESRRKSRLKSDEDNVRIYIVRDNISLNYKIGSSVNPLRRYNELCNKSNTTIIENKDLTLLWYSDPIERVEESNLHKHFKNKRINGEWFSLSEDDLSVIYKSINGTYVNRTSPRTENENENINKDKDVLSVLSENELNQAFEFMFRLGRKEISKDDILNYWEAFKVHKPDSSKETRAKQMQHFRDWLKFQKKENGNSKTHKLGTSEARIEALKNW